MGVIFIRALIPIHFGFSLKKINLKHFELFKENIVTKFKEYKLFNYFRMNIEFIYPSIKYIELLVQEELLSK